MQTTRALNSLKALFPPIHQPLPLDKREAQRLLDRLNASFRSQLDAEYGWSAPRPAVSQNLTKSPTVAASSSAAPSPASQSHGSLRSTDRHVHAILDNPLFLPTGSAPAPSGPISTVDAHKAIFEKAVSRGLMTVPRALGFLMLIRSEVEKARDAKAFSKLAIVNDLRPVGTAKLVVQWLRSSGQENGLAFLAHKGFRLLLMEFMAAEGLDDVVFAWLERVVDPAEPETLASAARLLQEFMNKKAQLHDLELAYTAFFRAEAMVRERKWPLSLLRMPWRAVSLNTTVFSAAHKPPPGQLFDAFVALGRAVPIVPFQGIDFPHLSLYHPAEPSSQLAREFLSSEERWLKYSTSNIPGIPRFQQLGVDTIRHLIKTNEPQEASRLWDMLRRYFSVGLYTRHSTAHDFAVAV
ncbi:hypothetical protein N658DRAFT_484377 [Parathielavia hyrcaniae]|uniref:Uncharacterized protein n=1 Tax=Parathielavia hyrcaniae TaxID=113614 RepID=A0AAN6Q745_9PEZI|nr:hypothetical protein N658DRAFT_484377 [Parathielavia hyrcaniae]